MRIRSFLAAAAIAATSIIPSAAFATPTGSQSAERLGQTIREVGVTMYVQCPEDAGFMGAYAPAEGAFIVCAEGRRPGQFTAEEQDTLRHEAIHLAQDCMDGIRGNALETTRYIHTLFQLVAESGINAAEIERLYRANGADDHTILLELEAWAGAAVFSNDEVNELVRKACRLPV